MGWETSHRNIDQVDLEGIDRDRRRILSGYVTSSKGYSKKVEELFKDIPDDAMVSVRDILGEMPDDLDDDIMAAIENSTDENEADEDFSESLDAVMRHDSTGEKNTASKNVSKTDKKDGVEVVDDIPSVRAILGGMPDELDDDIMAAIEGKNEFTSQLASIDNGVRPQERQIILQETKAINDMPEEMQEFYASQADEEYNNSLDAVMQH